MASKHPQDEDQHGLGDKHVREGSKDIHERGAVCTADMESISWDTLPNVQKAWETLELKVVWMAGRCKTTLNVTLSEVHLCKLQYAFTSEHAKKLHILELEELDHIQKVNCTCDHVEIILKDSFVSREESEVAKYVIRQVQTVVGSVFCKEIPVKLANRPKLFDGSMHTVPSQVKLQAVMVFYSKSSENLFFVGDKEANVSKVLARVDLEQLDEEEYVIEEHTWNMLDALDVQKFLEQEGCNVCIENNALRGTKTEIQKSRSVIESFQLRIRSREVKFKSPECADILLGADGEVNENVKAYFVSELSRNVALKINTNTWHFEIGKRKVINTSEVLPFLKVYCREEEKLDGAVNLIRECVKLLTVNAKTKEAQDYIEQWTVKKKIREISRTGAVVQIVCTRDMIKEIETLCSFDEEETKMAPEVVEFITQVDTDFIPEAEKKFSLRIDLHGNILCYKGRKENTKAFKKYMKQHLIRSSVPVTVSHSVLEPLKPTIEDIASRGSCCWKIKSPASPDETMLKSCEYIATWCHPRTGGKVSVILGDPIEVELDCLILLVNDSLYPLYELKQLHADLIDSSASFIHSIERNADYGAIVHGKPFANGNTKVVNLVIAKAHPKHPSENKHYYGLSDLVQRAFIQAMKDGCKSIGVPVPMMAGFLSVQDIAKAFVNSAVNIHNTKDKSTEMFLCCMKFVEVDEVIAEVDKVYEGQGQGFTRQMYTEDPAFSKDTNMLKCKVKKGSLIDMKVEVMVDTTNKKLDLSQGFLSHLLTERAGPNLQRECQQDYPEGVKYGEIAVTGAYDITQTNKHTKYIFHGALARKTEREKYEENVYEFVWNCLIECELKKCPRIAFPALGAGQLGYPRRDVAKAMFDAVEAFQNQALQPCLKKIIFALPDDDKKLYRIFSDEEKRRKKDAKKISKQRNTGYRALLTTLKISHAPVKVTVAVHKDIGILPSNVLEVFFTAKPGQCSTVTYSLKHSSVKPETWNDQLIVTGGSLDFKGAAAAGVEACFCDRVTEILVHTCTGMPVPIWEQIDIVVKEIQRVMSKTAPSSLPSALHTVYFAVADPTELNQAIGHLAPVKPTSSWATSFTSLASLRSETYDVYSSSQCTWHIIEVGPASAERMILDLVGKTEETVQRVETNIIGLLDEKMKEAEAKTGIDWKYESDSKHLSPGDERGAIPKGSNSTFYETNVDVAYKQSQGTSVDGDRRNPNDVINVSADISPGVIKSKQNGLVMWLSCIETKFNLKVTKYTCGRFTVTGSLTQLLKFEKHLDETIVENPAIDIGDGGDFVKGSGWNKGQGQSTPSAMVSEVNSPGSTVKTVASQSIQPKTQGYLKDVFNNGKRQFEEGIFPRGTESTSKVPNIPKGSSRQMDACITTSSGLNVYAVEGSIVTMNVDCIISATNEHLSAVMGVAKAVADAAGPEFKAACKEMIHGGRLNAWDCVETCPGKLHCEKVFHAVVPVKVQGRMSGELQQLVMKCLENADGSGFQSVALPFISAGESGLDLDVCIQQYYTAVSNFDKVRMSVSDIYFVDVKKDNVNKLTKMFQKFLNQENDASEQSRQSDRELDQGRQSGENETIQPVKIAGCGFDVMVEAEVGDISQMSVDAVVSIEDIEFQGEGKIAAALRHKGGDDYISKLRRLKGRGKSKCCISTEGGIPLKCWYVLHTVAPSFDHREHQSLGGHEHDPQSYEQDVVATMQNILIKASQIHCRSLAIPLLDGNLDSCKQPPPVSSCCSAMVRGIREYCSQPGNNPPRVIKLVDLDQKVVAHFYRALVPWDSSSVDTRL